MMSFYKLLKIQLVPDACEPTYEFHMHSNTDFPAFLGHFMFHILYTVPLPSNAFHLLHQLLFCRAEDCDDENMDNTTTLWVALAVVQSYNPRRKVPRSDISIPNLECCLSKASFSAAQNSGKFLHTLAYSDIKNWTV